MQLPPYCWVYQPDVIWEYCHRLRYTESRPSLKLSTIWVLLPDQCSVLAVWMESVELVYGMPHSRVWSRHPGVVHNAVLSPPIASELSWGMYWPG